MLDELVALDLTAGEARVYLSLLKLGSSKVGAIVGESRVSYSKVYDVLERLANKGLVSHVQIGKVRHFSAAEPSSCATFTRLTTTTKLQARSMRGCTFSRSRKGSTKGE